MIDTSKFKTRKSLIVAGMVVIGILGILAVKEAHANPPPLMISGAIFGPISIPAQPVARPPVTTFSGPIIGRVVAPGSMPPVNIGGFHGPIIGPGGAEYNHNSAQGFFYSPSINLPMFG
ncbi:MAG: hypothetical protein M0Z50_00970 [Planctomycetia bacterium]|jgi:hypothetical protein|nr:hypothetical protein [Planctomycetia bacterium]